MNNDPITVIKGIGEKTAGYYKNLGIETVEDLVHYYPARFIPYPAVTHIADIRPGEETAVYGRLGRAHMIPGRLKITEVYIEDETGKLRCLWFNAPYMAGNLAGHTRVVLLGKVSDIKGRLALQHPTVYEYDEYIRLEGNLKAVYRTTEGLSSAAIQKSAVSALRLYGFGEDYLPHDIRARYGLMGEAEAMRTMHMCQDTEDSGNAPRDTAKDRLDRARKRLVFDEFLSFIYSARKLCTGDKPGSSYRLDTRGILEDYESHLPYVLTDAQRRSAEEIFADMSSGSVMNRLIQGDVGSGKTAVALAALYAAYRNGHQGVIMVPTEVLANQHFTTCIRVFSAFDKSPVICLLTGSMTAAKKADVKKMIRDHQADIIIGTHAIIQKDVKLADAAVVITDEQHRFGVKQREMLSSKGNTPHILVMSATPIPRTLAVILYGDLDISVIDKPPAGRLPVKNAVVDSSYRKKAWKFMKEQVEEGHQCYVICPLIESSDGIDAENVTDYTASLRAVFPEGIVIQSLDGRMKQTEKDRIMRGFKDGSVNILVSTTVVEVGVDVPNATVMLIENADRFGLAALHQLRGRVGRGPVQSYCIFVNGSDSPNAGKRLEIIGSSNDGFLIASEDLKLRGPGEILGICQSGQLHFEVADIYRDADVLKMADDCIRYTESEEFRPDDAELIRFIRHMEDYRDRKLSNITL